MDNYIVINGKRAELTPEQLKALGIETEKSPFEFDENGKYYFITSLGNINEVDCSPVSRKARYDVANYCTDKAIMEQRAMRETLNRLLWRYSMEHDGDKINWSSGKAKWHIYVDASGLKAMWGSIARDISTVYFYSETICIRAIKEIVEPFMKEHPDFRI